MSHSIPSPCVGICKLNKDRICVGCGRTSDEISSWLFFKEDKAKEVLNNSYERLLNVNT